ncbi:MAG: putative phage tail protein [Lachnospirales bacterium]|jgi:hypothetical protein
MALNDYLPLFLRNVKEFGIINSAFDIENEEIQKSIADFMKENFVMTAENQGLSRMEKILGINGEGNSVALRRYNILAEMRKGKQDLISLLMKFSSGVEYEFTDEYNLKIKVASEGREYLPAIKQLLEKYVPCNIALDIAQLYATHLMTAECTHLQLNSYSHKQIRERR